MSFLGRAWDSLKGYGAGAVSPLGAYFGGAYGAVSGWNGDIGGSGQRADIDPNAGRYTNADQLRAQMQSGLDAVRGRQAPQADRTQVGNVAQVQGGPQDQFRAQQIALANRLQGISSGQQQGAGELAAQRQGNRAIAQQQAFARMGRGANAATAARASARNAGGIGLNTAGLSQQAALQDQQMATGQLAGLASQGREQDIGIQRANMDAQNQRIFQQAGLDQSTSLANMQARLQQTGMDDQASLAYLAQLHGVSVAEMQGRLAQEQMKIGNYDPGWMREFTGNLLGAAGGVVGAVYSDRRLKKDTRKVSAQIDELLEKIKPHSYRYKDALHGEGRRAGVMAQDLEKSEAGRRIVREGPDGKQLDGGAAISAALASVARLHERMKALEGKGK